MNDHPTAYAARIAAITMPSRIRALPVHPDLRLPIPWFCQQNPPDFRVIRGAGFAVAHRQHAVTGLQGRRHACPAHRNDAQKIPTKENGAAQAGE